ncbi:dihydrolipoamide acetyltransferase family protein [Bacillus testis]|uniref:dihydrolipoamide acetyltransferase family protein n=1 Tax=Bacillus testis TaxID=1622072 RepID=UPI000A84331B|nr:dihydrolipoamide acetyltransferase family protein [Bacillus testis]
MIELKLHDIGEGMTEGEITSYFIKEGDSVKADEPLVEVQTDKMVAELPSPITGFVKQILYPVGSTIPVGTTLLYLDTEAPVPNKEISSGEEKRQTATAILPRRILATPYTRKIARENGINLEELTPTDPSGRITEEEVYAAIKSKQENGQQPKQPAKNVTPNFTSPQHADFVPFTGVRKQTANKMTESMFTIPHVTHFEEINMTRLKAFKENLKADGLSISITAFFLKALVICLKEFPIFNSSLDVENEKIILHPDHHIGLAANTDKGLFVPVIKDAGHKSLRALSAEAAGWNQKAKDGQITAKDCQKGTFTVSNVGPLGSIAATPIIHFPQTAIIAFHKTRKMPIVTEQDEIAIGYMMNLSMSFDHRIADGATAIAFTNLFKELIEKPNRLMMELI